MEQISANLHSLSVSQGGSDKEEGARERAIRKNWFQGLTGQEQDGIIRPHFEKAHPTNADIRKAADDHDRKTGQK